ncbi:MAG TPA: hypothetical protein VN861_01235 [Candidatus Acidoferrales bacterium]|nr:hypothetical protein [Candidatus Acidoferrales bacterium]
MINLPNGQRDRDVRAQELHSERISSRGNGDTVGLKTFPGSDEIAWRGMRDLDVVIHLANQIFD